jgi:transcription antitermination factor NusG
VNDPDSAAAEPSVAGEEPVPSRLFLPRPDALWTAAHTRPRCEKQAAEFCARFGLTHYLPLRRQVKRYQRRNVEHFLPMFRGYLFVQLEDQQRLDLLASHRVVRLLPIDTLKEAVLLRDLEEVRRLELAARERELIVQPELVPGRDVRISRGPLQGLHGVVTRRQNRTRVSVNVELLGQSVSVDLDVGEVESEPG